MIKNIERHEKNNFNKLSLHPLQSWEWGEFRLKTGIEVLRLGRYLNNKLIETALITIHPIPFTSYKIGYFPKGGIPSKEMLNELIKIGVHENLIFIKMEPNLIKNLKSKIPAFAEASVGRQKPNFDIRESPHPLFTRYTFQLDLTKSEDELMQNMHHKTRYNTGLARKKGVTISEDDPDEAFKEYLKLMKETTLRQKFYAHTEYYHRLMWETLKPPKIAKLFLAKYKDEEKNHTLVAWILFLFNKVLYYPYGASSTLFRNLMPSNLMMWEVIKFGKRMGATKFDMWGALAPNPQPSDPWSGFHKFKEGYGGELVELAGSFDLIIKPSIYRMYNLAHGIRELYLKITR